MNTARVGKIARLPKHIRDRLNERLEDGEPGKQIVEWLNGLSEAREVLKLQFGGRPITEQNLSEWKQGGYLDWQQHQESRQLVERLGEQADDLAEDAGDQAVSDRLATLLAVELVRTSQALLKETTDPRERWQLLRELLQQLGQLRRDDHRAARLLMDQALHERETDRMDEETRTRESKAAKQRACAPLFAMTSLGTMSEAFGGGEAGRQIAGLILEVQHDLPEGTLTRRAPSGPSSPPAGSPDQIESNLIQPNPTESK